MEPCDTKIATFDYSSLSASFWSLSKPDKRTFISNAILTIDHLAKWKRKKVAWLHGIGPSVLANLDQLLSAEGLRFK